MTKLNFLNFEYFKLLINSIIDYKFYTLILLSHSAERFVKSSLNSFKLEFFISYNNYFY